MTARAEAELRKLGHALGVAPERLAGLDGLAEVPAEQLRALRAQLGEMLFQADRHHFVKVATLSKAVPVAVAAKLTVLTLPPLLAARTAELLDPHRAVELVGRLPEPYLADVSAAMDPARAADIIRQIPAERVAAVGVELAGRREWVVIGSFVAHVSADGLAASVRAFDGEQLLRISFVLDDLSRLDTIAGLLTDRQLEQMLAAAHEQSLWTELRELVAQLSDERVDRLRARLAEAPAEVASAVRANLPALA